MLNFFGAFGITGGAHRLWTHRSYKAKWPLRLIVAVGQTIAAQVIKYLLMLTFNSYKKMLYFDCRTIFMNGVEITEFIINLARRTLIHTMPNEVSFSHTSAGCCVRNILKSFDVERQ